MKRPLAAVGFTYFISLLIAERIGAVASISVAALTLVSVLAVLLIMPLKKYKAVIVCAVTACAALSVFFVNYTVNIKPTEKYYNAECTVTARVCSEQWTQYGNYYFLADIYNINGDTSCEGACVRVCAGESLDVRVSDIIEIPLSIYSPDGGGFSDSSYNYYKGIQLYGYANSAENLTVTQSEHKSIEFYLCEIRNAVSEKLKSVLSKDTAALAVAMLLGDKSLLGDDITEWFRNGGISHLLAVSGLHTVIIARLFATLFSLFKIKGKKASVLTMLCIVLFMAVVGFTPSVTRAGIMMLIILSAELFSREADSLNSLGFACLLICLFNPYAVKDIGLQLSVCATLGLVVLTPKISGLLRKYTDKIKNPTARKISNGVCAAFAETVGATVFTLPVSVGTFGTVSVVSPLVNILCVYPATLFLCACVIVLVLPSGRVIRAVAAPFVFAAEILKKYISAVAEAFSSLWFSRVNISPECIYIWAIGTAVLFFAAYLLRKSKRLYKMTAALSSMFFIFSVTACYIINGSITTTTVINTDGGCAVAVVNNGRAFMINCGGDKLSYLSAEAYLRERSVNSMELMVFTELDDKNCRGAENVIEKYRPQFIIMPSDGDRYDEIGYNAQKCGVPIYDIANASCTVFGDNLDFYTDEYGSTWCYYNTNGYSVLVCPGVGNAGVLPEYMRNCTLLVVTSASIGGLENITCSKVVVTAEDEELEIAADVLQSFGCEQYITMQNVKTVSCYKLGDSVYIKESE